jgi:uncharacterized protein
MTAKELVTQVFARWEQGDQTSFFDALAAEVQWTAIGSTPISGHYTSKAEYLEQVYQPLRAHFSGPTQRLSGNSMAPVCRFQAALR